MRSPLFDIDGHILVTRIRIHQSFLVGRTDIRPLNIFHLKTNLALLNNVKNIRTEK